MFKIPRTKYVTYLLRHTKKNTASKATMRTDASFLILDRAYRYSGHKPKKMFYMKVN